MANDRRKFLGKLALGAGSLAALPLIGANSRKDEEEMEEVSSVEILKQMSDVHSDDEEDSGEI